MAQHHKYNEACQDEAKQEGSTQGIVTPPHRW